MRPPRRPQTYGNAILTRQFECGRLQQLMRRPRLISTIFRRAIQPDLFADSVAVRLEDLANSKLRHNHLHGNQREKRRENAAQALGPAAGARVWRPVVRSQHGSRCQDRESQQVDVAELPGGAVAGCTPAAPCAFWESMKIRSARQRDQETERGCGADRAVDRRAVKAPASARTVEPPPTPTSAEIRPDDEGDDPLRMGLFGKLRRFIKTRRAQPHPRGDADYENAEDQG